MKNITGAIVVFIVSVAVLSSAGGIIYASLIEEHSSPKLVAMELRQAGLLQQTLADTSSIPTPFIEAESTVVLGATQEGKPSLSCAEQLETLPYQTKRSLVNYLVTKGESSSFESRAALASTSGITEYRGTSTQNLELLRKLMVINQELTSDCINYYD